MGRLSDVHSHPAMTAPKRQAAPRFAPEISLSVAAVPHPKSPALAEPAALSKSTHLRLTHPAPIRPLPLNPSSSEIQFPGNDCGLGICPRLRAKVQTTSVFRHSSSLTLKFARPLRTSNLQNHQPHEPPLISLHTPQLSRHRTRWPRACGRLHAPRCAGPGWRDEALLLSGRARGALH